jgi:hypothetical protein
MTGDLDYLRGVLGGIEKRAQAIGCGWVTHARPGPSPEQIGETMAPTGLRLPPEAELLFSWHDGVEDDRTPHARRFLPPFEFFPLSERVDWYLKHWRPRVQEIAAGTFPDSEDYWPRRYFPILDTGDRFNAAAVMVRCSTADDPGRRDVLRSMPVLLSGEEAFDEASQHQSLISLLETWVGWIDDGTVRWDREQSIWQVQDSARHRSTWASAFM